MNYYTFFFSFFFVYVIQILANVFQVNTSCILCINIRET